MRRAKIVITGILIAGSLLVSRPVFAQGPTGRNLSQSRRIALVTVRGAQWAWASMYTDALSIYGGAKMGYHAIGGAFSRTLTPRWANR